MKTLICYSNDSDAYETWLRSGQPADFPDDVPFGLPDAARKGDRYLLFVGGQDQAYVGWGIVRSEWRVNQTGGWKGIEQVTVSEHLFRTPVPGTQVAQHSGFRNPSGRKVVPTSIADSVWAAAFVKPTDTVKSALEGIRAETSSRSRNNRLRAAAISRAGGVCECCGTDFSRVAGGLGRRCLVVHHKKQLKDSDQPVETKLSELAVVCANCHMMIHADPNKARKIGNLRRALDLERKRG